MTNPGTAMKMRKIKPRNLLKPDLFNKTGLAALIGRKFALKLDRLSQNSDFSLLG